MTDVQVNGLAKRYGAKTALNSIDLEISAGEFVTLLGPSGCGKTSTLRCLAGLERPTEGTITMGGRVMVDTERGVFVPPEKRQVGMVFQSYALWPHMSVWENVSYPLKVARVGRVERGERVQFMLDSVGLGEFAQRSVTALSGGQQQRVALARALAARPGIIFYDEPLSNLDTKLRYRMSQQVRELHDTFETTSIYVTHDQEEAITLSDRIVIMNHGSIEQIGKPTELYDRPATSYVADFMGFGNVLSGTVVGSSSDSVDVKVADSDIVLRGLATVTPAAGSGVTIAFRASHVHLDPAAASGPGSFVGVVTRTTFVGSAVNLLVDASGIQIRARIERSDLDRLGRAMPVAGDRLDLAVSARGAVLVDGGGQTPVAYATEGIAVPPKRRQPSRRMEQPA